VKNDVAVVFEKTANGYVGKLRDIPMDLFAEIAKFEHGKKITSDIVSGAKKSLSEFFEHLE
jgi:hypothetical protein